MIYEFVKRQQDKGLVSVGLPSRNSGPTPNLKASEVTLLSSGITALAIALLSKSEKLSIAEFAIIEAREIARKRYFEEPTSYANNTQYDVDRIIIRGSHGDYSKGTVLHMLDLSNGLNEADFISDNIAQAKANFKLYELSTGSNN